MRYFSVFTGAGGFEQGMPADWECVGFSEIDKYANMVLRYHWPDIKNYGDINAIDWTQIPNFDLLIGGSPCQDLSLAGKRKGLAGERSGLFFAFAKALRDKLPDHFIWENVKGALSSNQGWDFAEVLNQFSALGYNLWWQVLNAKDFGVPQNRERIFVIGIRDGSPSKVFLEPEINQVSGKKGRGQQSKGEGLQGQISSTIDARYGALRNSGETYLKYVGGVMGEKNKKWLEDGKDFSRNFPQGHRVYASDGISASLSSNAGGWGGKTGLCQVLDTYNQRVRNESGALRDPKANTNLIINRSQRDYLTRDDIAFTVDHIPNMVVQPVLTPNRAKKRQNGRRMKEAGEDMFTLTGQDVHGVSVDSSIRRLTPLECERLMGWQDGWTKYGMDEKGNKVEISDTQRYKMCGNGVVSNVVRELTSRIINNSKET